MRGRVFLTAEYHRDTGALSMDDAIEQAQHWTYYGGIMMHPEGWLEVTKWQELEVLTYDDYKALWAPRQRAMEATDSMAEKLAIHERMGGWEYDSTGQWVDGVHRQYVRYRERGPVVSGPPLSSGDTKDEEMGGTVMLPPHSVRLVELDS